MPPKTKARHIRRTREPLVHQHLENVSRDLLQNHPELVREFIGRNAGVYGGIDNVHRVWETLAAGLTQLTGSPRHLKIGQDDAS
jgi:hypothetical protein